MSKSTSKPDRVSELRKRMGFPEDASRWMLVLLILALPPMLFWRHYVGSRMVSLFKMLAMSALMLLWGAIACLIVAGGDWDLQANLFAVMGAMELGIAMIGTAHRAIRWVMYQKGEKLSTLSPGISHFSRVIPNANAERYLDPLLTVGAGLLMCSPLSPLMLHAPGSWLVLSGIALYAIESHMHGIQLDQVDGLLRAEAHEQATTRFYNHSNEPASASSSTTKVPTGVDSDLQASILRRQQRRAQAAGATDEKPVPPVPPMPEETATSERQETATFRAASEKIFATEEPSPTAHPAAAAPKEVPRAAAKGMSDSERAKRNKLGAAIGIAVALGTMAAPSLKAGFATLVVPRAVPKTETSDESLDTSVMFQRAMNYREGKGGLVQDDAKAVRLFRMAAERGDAASQFNLGHMYQFGENGLEQNDNTAVAWYQKAAAKGHPDAAVNLGNMYLRGRGGLPKDFRQAASLYRLAADVGLAAGEFNLGFMYENGYGDLPKSDIEASKWYRKAAEQGDAAAENSLGGMYLEGRGVPRDGVAAVSWITKAADHGNRDGQAQLASMYLGGEGGLVKSESEAVKWLRPAAEQGEAWAQFRLGLMYELGRGGVEQDAAEAVQWFRKSALQDMGDAQMWLGMAYETGSGGLAKSKDEAMNWFRKAAANGNAEAKKFLEVKDQ